MRRAVAEAWRSRAVRVLAAFAAVAVAAAVWLGSAYLAQRDGAALTRAEVRDSVLGAASAALAALNTIDYRDPQRAVDRWTQVTAGKLGQSLRGDRELQVQRATRTKTVAKATVRRVAVSTLDATAGTARVLAALDIRISTGGERHGQRSSRLVADLIRTGDSWKVNAVQGAS